MIRLLDKITNGSKIVVTETGTCVFFQPGILVGGVFDHECCVQRAIGYYLEVLLSVGPFCKKPLHCTLKGVTNNKVIKILFANYVFFYIFALKVTFFKT